MASAQASTREDIGIKGVSCSVIELHNDPLKSQTSFYRTLQVSSLDRVKTNLTLKTSSGVFFFINLRQQTETLITVMMDVPKLSIIRGGGGRGDIVEKSKF